MKEPRGTATVSTARRETADVNRCQFTAVTSKCHRMLDPANVLSYDGILRNRSFLMVFSASRVLRTLDNQFFLHLVTMLIFCRLQQCFVETWRKRKGKMYWWLGVTNSIFLAHNFLFSRQPVPFSCGSQQAKSTVVIACWVLQSCTKHKRTQRRVVDYPKVGEVISKSYILLLYLEKADQFLLLKLVPCRIKFFFVWSSSPRVLHIVNIGVVLL